jgi:hypothetical protein
VSHRLMYEFLESPPPRVWKGVMKIVEEHQKSDLHTITMETYRRWLAKEVSIFTEQGYAEDIRYCEKIGEATFMKIVIERIAGGER